MTAPAVTVVVPLHNKQTTVERALRSVLDQTVRDFEIVVVDDGSTDQSAAAAERIGDPRVRLIRQANGGVSMARNRGIEAASAPVIAFLDADDAWMPEFLETVLRLRKRFATCHVYATNYVIACDNGQCRLPIIRGIPRGPWEGVLRGYFAIACRSDPPLFTSAVAARKETLLDVGGFPEGVTSGEDLLTWARLAGRHDIAYASEPLSIYTFRTAEWGPSARPPDPDDVVGRELRSMLTTPRHHRLRGLRRYLALWHKMRASQYLCLGDGRAGLGEVRTALRDWPLAYKLYAYAAIAALPDRASRRLMGGCRSLLNSVRSAGASG
ncbi:MAG: glycosyltransferase family 2 protein [Phycisphaerae bacterium]|nr:glycosyltransferase family 2 protein [Phycisphaerae bacterium]